MMFAQRVSLDQLVALNDEMAAITRAGLPLEQGLRALRDDLPGRLGRLAGALSERLERGQSLAEALQSCGNSFPAVYCAVVAAGVRSGRVAAALEGLSTTMRRAGELRRTFIAAMIYPLVVLTIAGSLFSFTVTKVSPVIVQTYVAMNAPRPDWYGYALAVAQHVPRATACALVLIGFLAVWWLCRSPWSVAWSAGRFGGFSLTGVLQAGRLATFAELMALMVEQQVPMAEAVELSTAASGDARLRQSGKALADRIRQGDTKAAIPPGMPPLLSWLLVVGMRQDQLIRSLRRYAAAYRRKAMYWGDWMSTYLPILLSAVFGGSVVLAYALLVMAPVYNLLFQLSGR